MCTEKEREIKVQRKFSILVWCYKVKSVGIWVFFFFKEKISPKRYYWEALANKQLFEMYSQLLLGYWKVSCTVFLVRTELYSTRIMGCRHTVHVLSHPFFRLTAKARDPSNCVPEPCVFNLQGSEKGDRRPLLASCWVGVTCLESPAQCPELPPRAPSAPKRSDLECHGQDSFINRY